MFLLGGSQPFGFFTLSNKILFEPVSSSSPPPSSLEGSSAVVYDEGIYLFGGMVNKKPTNNFNVYSINNPYIIQIKIKENNVWTTIECEECPSPRQYHSACVIGHSMYVYGGESSEGNLNDLWQFNFSKIEKKEK